MILVLAFAESSIQLVPDGTLFLHVFAVVAMIAILNRTLYRPINRVLNEREQQTKGRLTDAQAASAETEKNLARYEHALREARGAGYKLVEAQRTDALASREQTIAALKDELRSRVNDEKSELGVQVEQAKAMLEQESRANAESISRQILSR